MTNHLISSPQEERLAAELASMKIFAVKLSKVFILFAVTVAFFGILLGAFLTLYFLS